MLNSRFPPDTLNITIPEEKKEPKEEYIICRSFSKETEYKIYINNQTIKCTCKSYEYTHRFKGTKCKHIKMLAESILSS